MAQVNNTPAIPATLTDAQLKAGIKGTIALCSQLSMVLKQLGGEILSEVLPETDGLTVQQFLDKLGVIRAQKANGTFKPYALKDIRAAWAPGLRIEEEGEKEKKLCVFRKVYPKYRDGKKLERVYTLKEAKKIDGEPMYVIKPVAIGNNRWSISVLLNGLRQSYKFAEENTKAVESEVKFAEEEELYIVRNVEKDGQIVREIVKIDKSQVKF